MWMREHGRVYSAGSPVDTGEIALYKNYSLLSLLLLPCQASGTIGSALGLVGPVSVYCNWSL